MDEQVVGARHWADPSAAPFREQKQETSQGNNMTGFRGNCSDVKVRWRLVGSTDWEETPEASVE